MAADPHRQIINSSYRKNMGKKQSNMEVKVQPDLEKTIAKVLCVDAKVSNVMCETFNEEAKVTMQVDCNVMCMGEDGKLFCMKHTSNHTESFLEPLVKPKSYAITNCFAVESNVVYASKTEARIKIIIETELDCILTDEISCLKEYEDSTILKEEDMHYWEVSAIGRESFDVSEEFEVSGEVTEILMQKDVVNIQKVYAGSGYITLEGEIDSQIYYQDMVDDVCEIKMHSETYKFTEEIVAEDVNKNTMLHIYCNLDAANTKVIMSSDKSILRSDYRISVNYVGLEEKIISIINDAYSTKKEATLTMQSLDINKIMKTVCYNDKIYGDLSVPNKDEVIVKVLCTCGENVNVVKAYCLNGEVKIEGIMTTNVIYVSGAEENQMDSLQVEAPFMLNYKLAQAKEEDGVCAKVSVSDTVAKVKKGRDIDITMNVNVCLGLYAVEKAGVITEVSLTDDLRLESSALQIYMGKTGEKLWDVCKNLHIKEEIILEQNKDLEFPLKEDCKIIVYKQK